MEPPPLESIAHDLNMYYNIIYGGGFLKLEKCYMCKGLLCFDGVLYNAFEERF